MSGRNGTIFGICQNYIKDVNSWKNSDTFWEIDFVNSHFCAEPINTEFLKKIILFFGKNAKFYIQGTCVDEYGNEGSGRCWNMLKMTLNCIMSSPDDFRRL